MKKLVFLLLPLLLCGCTDAASRETRRENALFLLEQEPSFCMTVNCEDFVAEYRLQCRYTQDGAYIENLSFPAELAGLSATLAGEKLTLTYRDLYFAGETVGLSLPSPLYLYPLSHLALRDGSYVTTDLCGTKEVRDEYLYYFEDAPYTLRYFYRDGELTAVSFLENQTEYAQFYLTPPETSNE